MDAVKKVKVGFYGSVGVVIFSVLVMILAPIFIENYLWQIMLLPAAVHFPMAVGGYRALKRYDQLNTGG